MSSPSKKTNLAKVTLWQIVVWLVGGYLYLVLESLVPIPLFMSGIYASILLLALVAMPTICGGTSRCSSNVESEQLSLSPWWKLSFKDVVRGCNTPCIILLEILLLTGNISSWVVFEPFLITGLAPRACAQAEDPLPAQLPELHLLKTTQRQTARRNESIVDLHTEKNIVSIKSNAVTNAPLVVHWWEE